jgi:hypothetical protein
MSSPTTVGNISPLDHVAQEDGPSDVESGYADLWENLRDLLLWGGVLLFIVALIWFGIIK